MSPTLSRPARAGLVLLACLAAATALLVLPSRPAHAADGCTGTGVTPSHTYTSPGSYPVTLTVTDAAGNTASVTPARTASC